MNKFYTIILLLITTLSLQSQNFEDLDFGTNYTLDIVTWNTEWFPTNGSATVNYVAEIVEAMDAEIIAFQEIDDKDRFQDLIDLLDDYDGYYISNDSYQGLAYLYHKNRIDISDQYEIFEYDWSEFPRSPLILEFKFDNEDYILINNHLKCCGDGILVTWDYDDEENRRYRASKMLDDYIDQYFDSEKVIMVGDLNDEITDDLDNNVFKNFINDGDHYLFADMEIAEGSSSNWSYPDWPSHLDHILITNELFNIFNESASSCEVIKVDEFFPYWGSYENNISDHRPVGIKLQTKEIGLEELASNSVQVFPNPFENQLEVRFDQDVDMIKIYQSNGVLVFESSVHGNEDLVGTQNWSSGLYLIQTFKDYKLMSSKKVLKK
jgi:endonuclease/exonuclease/phosphatase family metal-dependent hydrolase